MSTDRTDRPVEHLVVVGALTVNRPRQIMKLRRLIATDAPWADAVQLATDFADLSAPAVAG